MIKNNSKFSVFMYFDQYEKTKTLDQAQINSHVTLKKLLLFNFCLINMFVFTKLIT